MSENKFTPGPWETTPYSGVVGCVITAQPDKTKNQFNIGSIHGGESKQQVLANAKLAATAPELLQALIEAREMLITKGMKEDSVGLIGINNVIKKATE